MLQVAQMLRDPGALAAGRSSCRVAVFTALAVCMAGCGREIGEGGLLLGASGKYSEGARAVFAHHACAVPVCAILAVRRLHEQRHRRVSPRTAHKLGKVGVGSACVACVAFDTVRIFIARAISLALHAQHRIVVAGRDGPIVSQEDVGDARKRVERLGIVCHDWLAAAVAAGHDERGAVAQHVEEQMLHGRRGQHDAGFG